IRQWSITRRGIRAGGCMVDALDCSGKFAMSGASASSAAHWYSEAGRSKASAVARRPSTPGPRALEARGFATLHHILVQLSNVGDRPRFAEACKAFGDVVWCDDLDELAVRATAREALAVVVDVADRQGTPGAQGAMEMGSQRPRLPRPGWR